MGKLSLLITMLLCAGVNSDQTSMAQPSPNQVDPLDPFEVYLHQECPAPAEAIIPLSNNHSFTTTTLRACAELCYAKQHCVAAKFRIDRSISSCTLLSIGCPIDSAKKQTKMTDEVTEILLIKKLRFPTLDGYYFLPHWHCHQRFFQPQLVSSPERCKHLCDTTESCRAFELQKVRFFYVCTVFWGFRCHYPDFYRHTSTAYYIRRTDQNDQLTDVHKFNVNHKFQCRNHHLTMKNFTIEGSLDMCLKICNSSYTCRGFYLKHDRCAMVDTMCTAYLYVPSSLNNLQLVFKQGARAPGYNVHEARQCGTGVKTKDAMWKTRLKMMHKDKIEDCVKECDKTFGCRSVGFHWDLVNMAFTAETNVTDEDLANWYNCVLYKHPCDQFLVDKFDRGSYHFSKLVTRVYNYKVFPGVWLRGVNVEEVYTHQEYYCGERCDRSRKCSGFFFAPQLINTTLMPCLLYSGQLEFERAEDSHFNLYWRDTGLMEISFMGMLKQQQKFWTVEDYFKHYRNTSCIPVFDGIPQWEMYQPTSRLSIEYKIQTKEQWSRFVINRTRHSVEECRRLCFVNPLCEMALFIHHVNHISLSVINRTSNCIQLPFVCKEKDLIAVTSIDLYIKDAARLYTQQGANFTGEDWHILKQFEMVENVKCQEFDKNVLPLTATNLSLSDCAQKCLNEHKCLSFHHVTQQQFTDGHSCELAAIECPVGVLMTSDSLFSRNFHYVKADIDRNFLPSVPLGFQVFRNAACRLDYLPAKVFDFTSNSKFFVSTFEKCVELCRNLIGDRFDKCESFLFCKHSSCASPTTNRLTQFTQYPCEIIDRKCPFEERTYSPLYDYFELKQLKTLVT